MGNAHANELLQTPIKELVPKGQTLEKIAHDSTVASALIQLKESGVSNLPVNGSDGGTVSFSDLVYLLVEKNFDQTAFLDALVRDAVRPHHSILVQPTSTVESVILRMLKYRPYRVCITSEGENSLEIQSVCSQSDIIQFIYAHREVLIADHLDKTLLQLPKLGSKGRVISVKEEESVREVCLLLTHRRVHAVAVEDANGLMTGTVVPTTFRSLSSTHWIDWSNPIGKFEVEGRDPGWVTSDVTFEHVLEMMVKHNLHRVFVLSEAGHPARVITLSDVMRRFVESTDAGKAARKAHKQRKKDKKKE